MKNPHWGWVMCILCVSDICCFQAQGNFPASRYVFRNPAKCQKLIWFIEKQSVNQKNYMQVWNTWYRRHVFPLAKPTGTFCVTRGDGSTDSSSVCCVIHGSEGVYLRPAELRVLRSFAYHTPRAEGDTGYMRFSVEKRISFCANSLHFPYEDGWWVQTKAFSPHMVEIINLNSLVNIFSWDVTVR